MTEHEVDLKTGRYKHPYMKRMREGMKIDREVTETFKYSSDHVVSEGDRMSKPISYTAKESREDDMCIACDEHISTGQLYIRKVNKEREKLKDNKHAVGTMNKDLTSVQEFFEKQQIAIFQESITTVVADALDSFKIYIERVRNRYN